MRGSQWEERGPPIRLERVLVAVGIIVVLCVLAVYFYTATQGGPPAPDGSPTSITSTGVGCGTGSLSQAATEVENDQRFAALSGGHCYDYVGESSSAGTSTLTFDYYNGTITYPCGTSARDVIAGQIDANVTSGGVTGVWAGGPNLNPSPSCPDRPPVSVVSVTDVSSLIPAVPELAITMGASSGGDAVVSLKASVTLVGTTQEFVLVASPSTLKPGAEVSKTEIVSPSAPFSSSVLYPMTVSGSLADGQTFAFQAYVQIADVP